MSAKELKNGFYWVKYLGEEQIAEYYNGSFLITGNENCQEPEIMDEINERVERGQYLTTSDVKALPIQNVSAMFKTEKECIDYFIKIMPFAIAPTRPAKTKLINPFTSHNAFLKVAEVIGKSVFNLR